MGDKDAFYYHNEGGWVICDLCPRRCRIGEGKTGFCRVRRNGGGKLYADNYALCSSIAVDPIEKKPLYHFYPGASILSVGTWGCNFSCAFCQNWQIAQGVPDVRYISPEDLVDWLKKSGSACIGVAYTYSEPIVWYEYVRETAQRVHEAGYKNVMVTNGFISEEPLRQLLPWIDGMNIDVKSFQQSFYSTICSGQLEAVKDTVRIASEHCHVEVTNLLIPGMNDSEEEVNALAEWLAGVRPSIPLHFSRYFPRHKFTLPPTPKETLIRAYGIGKKYLENVYVGNLETVEHANSYCRECGATVIDRRSWTVNLKPGNVCSKCGASFTIVGTVYM